MLEIITKTINQTGTLWDYRGPFLEFCRDHPFWAAVVIFFLFIWVGFIAVTNFLDFIHKIAHWMRSTRGRVGVAIGFCAVSLLSVGAVVSINALAAPAPSFLEDVARLVVGEPVFLRWSYAGNAGNAGSNRESQHQGSIVLGYAEDQLRRHAGRGGR